MGSAFALGLLFKSIGKNVSVYLEEPVPRMLDFLPGQHLITFNSDEVCDLAVCVDTSDMKKAWKGFTDLYKGLKEDCN